MIALPLVSLIGLSLVGSQIWSIRNIVLEEFTLDLAAQYSKTFGSGELVDHEDSHLHRSHSDPSFIHSSPYLTRTSEPSLNHSSPYLRNSSVLAPSFIGDDDLVELKLPLAAHNGERHTTSTQSKTKAHYHTSRKGKERAGNSQTRLSRERPHTMYDMSHSQESQPSDQSHTNDHSQEPNQSHDPQTLTISRSSRLPQVTVMAIDGLGRGHILETTKRKLYMHILFSLLLLLAIIFLSGCLFAFIEGWQFWEGVYFSYISIMTIGYGDYVLRHHISRSIFIWYL